jgi:hypothetical protein
MSRREVAAESARWAGMAAAKANSRRHAVRTVFGMGERNPTSIRRVFEPGQHPVLVALTQCVPPPDIPCYRESCAGTIMDVDAGLTQAGIQVRATVRSLMSPS